MNIIWTPEAQEDRFEIWEYIASDNPQAAARIDNLFSHAVAQLSEYPLMGQPGKISGTRELIPHKHYRLVYEIHQQTLWILALVHTSRQWPFTRK